MYQWQGVELETGFTQLSFPLTSEPIQGSYKIVVQKSYSSHVEHSFSVEEYGKERRYGLQVGADGNAFYCDLLIWDFLGMAWGREGLNT